MACSCNNWYYNLPCCCPTSDPTTSTTTTQCLNGEPCEESFSSDCVVFQGEGALCYNIAPGQSITDIIKILIDQLPQCTTTTTSTTTTTTTTPPCLCVTILNEESLLDISYNYRDCITGEFVGVNVIHSGENGIICMLANTLVIIGPGSLYSVTTHGDCATAPECNL